MPYTNTTQISGPGSQGNPFGQISSALAPIYSMFGPASGAGGAGGGGQGNLFGTPISGGNQGGGPGSFGISPLTNPDNSLTGEWYNLANIAGPAATGLLTQGSNVVNQGMGITGAGVDTTGAGLGVTGAGLNMFQQPYDYWSALLSGNPQAVAAAAGPYSSLISDQTNQALTQTRQGGPVGGASAVGQAGLPQRQIANVGNFELGLQPAAAQQEAGIAGNVAGIGQGISQTGLGLGNLGQTVAGTGTTLTGQGMQGLQNLIADVLQKMGINIQGGTANTFGTIASGIGNLLGGAGQVIHGKGGCWIAEAIYGADDPRTHLVRAYLNGPFMQTAFGRFVMSFYLRFGQAVAAQVRKRGWLKRAFQPLFDRALTSATAWRGV